MKEKLKDIGIRAFKTFWQTALASFIIAMPEFIELIPDWAALKPALVSVGVGALAAGLSAAYNGVIKPTIEKLKNRNKLTNLLDELDINEANKQ